MRPASCKARWRSRLAGVLAIPLAGFAFDVGAAGSTCKPPVPTVLVERFMSAACASCWSSEVAVDGVVLDWVAPASDAAPLAARSISEAGARAPGLPVDRVLHRQASLVVPPPARLRVVDGFAFNGYIGLQLEITLDHPLAPGLRGYMALVERIRAGRDGTGVDRQLVRAVVGPLSLAELTRTTHVRHLAAVRVPEAAQPERLASVGWLEDAGGTVVAFVESTSAACR